LALPSGLADREKTDAGSGETRLFAKHVAFGVDKENRDTDYITQYRRALLDVGVPLFSRANNFAYSNAARSVRVWQASASHSKRRAIKATNGLIEFRWYLQRPFPTQLRDGVPAILIGVVFELHSQI
jgi:hypothetical protein